MITPILSIPTTFSRVKAIATGVFWDCKLDAMGLDLFCEFLFCVKILTSKSEDVHPIARLLWANKNSSVCAETNGNCRIGREISAASYCRNEPIPPEVIRSCGGVK